MKQLYLQILFGSMKHPPLKYHYGILAPLIAALGLAVQQVLAMVTVMMQQISLDLLRPFILESTFSVRI